MALPIFGRFMQKVYKDPSLGISKNAAFGYPSGIYDVNLNCEPYINPLDTLYQDTLGFDFNNEPEIDTFSRWDKIKERIRDRDNEIPKPAEPKPEAPKPIIVEPKPEPKKEEEKKEDAPPEQTPAPVEPPKEPETPD